MWLGSSRWCSAQAGLRNVTPGVMIVRTLGIILLCCCRFLSSVVAAQDRETCSIIAHRGVPAEAPENTVASFVRAIKIGVEMIEVDVQQTLDGHLVVFHDKTLDRTTDGTGALRDATLDGLKQLDAGGWFSERFRGERIPTLDEVIDILPPETNILLEIKYGSPYQEGIERRLIDFLKERKLLGRVLIKSFDIEVVQSVRSLAPEIPVGISFIFRVPFLSMIVHRWIRFGDVLDEDVDFLHVHRLGVTQSLIEEAHKEGMRVIAWDVNDETTMARLMRMGVDGIETDEAALLKQIRRPGDPPKFKTRVTTDN